MDPIQVPLVKTVQPAFKVKKKTNPNTLCTWKAEEEKGKLLSRYLSR